jgi:Ca2+-transporting ATPase
VIDGKELDLTDQTQRYLLYDAVLTYDSSIVDGKGIGDPTEYALLEMFRKIQVLPDSYFGKMGMHEDALRKVMDIWNHLITATISTAVPQTKEQRHQ